MNSLRQYIDILYEAEYDTRIAKLTQLYPDHKTDFDWAKTNLVRKDRIYWYLKQAEDLIKNNKPQDIKPLQDNLFHYIGQTNIQGIQNYPFNINQTTQDLFAQLQQIEQKYNANTRSAALTTPNDIDLIKYPDGTRWIQLDRAYCEQEGLSGKHCGNVMGKQKLDQRILSYRDNRDRVILTFILEPNGTLGEMKGISNNKPDNRYHKQILDLLMLPAIKGIISGGYAPDQNFSIFDLDENYVKYVQDNKPSLIVDQLKATPIDILRAPDFIKKNINYTNVVKQKLPDIGNLIDNPSLDNWDQAITSDESMILYAPDELNDYENKLLKYLIKLNAPLQFSKVRKKYRTNYNFIFKLLNEKPGYILAIPETMNRYRELQLLALNKHGTLLQRFPEEKRDYEMCMTAVKSGRQLGDPALKFVPYELQLKHPELLLEAVKNNGLSLQYVSAELQEKYPNIPLEALKYSGLALQFVTNNLKLKRPELSLAAVKQYGHALLYVPDQLKFDNINICLEAVKQYGGALQYVPKEIILKYPKISLEAVKNDSSSLMYVPEELQLEYPNIPLKAIKDNAFLIGNISIKTQLKYPVIPKTVIKIKPEMLSYIPIEMQLKHPNIPLEAVKHDGILLQYVPEEVQKKYPNISVEAIKNNIEAADYVPEMIFYENPEIMAAIIKKDRNYIHGLDEFPKEYKDTVLQALEKDDDDELKEFKNILNKLIIKT